MATDEERTAHDNLQRAARELNGSVVVLGFEDADGAGYAVAGVLGPLVAEGGEAGPVHLRKDLKLKKFTVVTPDEEEDDAARLPGALPAETAG